MDSYARNFIKKMLLKMVSIDEQELFIAVEDEIQNGKYSDKTKERLIAEGFNNPDVIRDLFNEYIDSTYSYEIDDAFELTNEQKRIIEKARELAQSNEQEQIEKYLETAFRNEYDKEAPFYFIKYGFAQKDNSKKLVELFLLDNEYMKNKKQIAEYIFGGQR